MSEFQHDNTAPSTRFQQEEAALREIFAEEGEKIRAEKDRYSASDEIRHHSFPYPMCKAMKDIEHNHKRGHWNECPELFFANLLNLRYEELSTNNKIYLESIEQELKEKMGQVWYDETVKINEPYRKRENKRRNIYHVMCKDDVIERIKADYKDGLYESSGTRLWDRDIKELNKYDGDLSQSDLTWLEKTGKKIGKLKTAYKTQQRAVADTKWQ
ncbi:hypothetical protein FACS1894151_08490 [Spirochaetia bacterium]|nr:hypothetical protein FACS1894151_08490 [Spirochaetia bacterium]